jgi:hypothetical protein
MVLQGPSAHGWTEDAARDRRTMSIFFADVVSSTALIEKMIHARLIRALGGVKLVILDDWGLEPLGAGATP